MLPPLAAWEMHFCNKPLTKERLITVQISDVGYVGRVLFGLAGEGSWPAGGPDCLHLCRVTQGVWGWHRANVARWSQRSTGKRYSWTVHFVLLQ